MDGNEWTYGAARNKHTEYLLDDFTRLCNGHIL